KERVRPARFREQPRGADGSSDTFVERVGTRERHRDEGGDERKVAPTDRGRQILRRRWKKSPVAELCAGVSGGRHLVEDLRRRRGQLGRVEFERTPRTGRIGHADHRKSRSLFRACSYAARAFCTSGLLDTSATGT